MQLLELVAPVLMEYRPAPQSTQLLELLLEYRPARHWSVQLLAPVLLLEYRPTLQPMQLLDNKAMAIHLRGKGGAPGYERPFKVEATNPLAAWAEKKKAEAEASKKSN